MLVKFSFIRCLINLFFGAVFLEGNLGETSTFWILLLVHFGIVLKILCCNILNFAIYEFMGLLCKLSWICFDVNEKKIGSKLSTTNWICSMSPNLRNWKKIKDKNSILTSASDFIAVHSHHRMTVSGRRNCM